MSALPVNFSSDPIEQFNHWFEDAKACPAVRQANAACLSTLDVDGYPDGRMVLLKQHDARGFVFFTNLESVKGRSLSAVPRASLTFYWEPLNRQIRIQGNVERVCDDEADAYWSTRPRLSQLGAWASQQSAPLDRLRTFIQRLRAAEQRFGKEKVSRPPYWTGLRIVPHKIEFWRSRRGRLHERFIYRKQKKFTWIPGRLYP